MSQELRDLIKATLNYYLREKLPLPASLFLIILEVLYTFYRDDDELWDLLRKSWRMSAMLLGEKRFPSPDNTRTI